MKDLTDGSIAKNILQMALPIAAGMFFQTLYFLIDLYFVAGPVQPAAIAVGEQFLRIISWNFVASGLVFTSALFQGMGNTMPAVLSSASRIVSFIVPALWLSSQPQFQLIQLWHVSVVSVTLQACIGLSLVRGEFRQRVGAHADLGAAQGRSIPTS